MKKTVIKNNIFCNLNLKSGGNSIIKTVRNLIFCMALVFAVVNLSGCGNKADSYYKEGQKYVKSGSYLKAADSYRKAVSRNGERSDYYIALGIAENACGNYEDAVMQFKKAVNPSENSVSKSYAKQAYYGEASAYLAAGDYESAVRYSKKALDYSEPESLTPDIMIVRASAEALEGDTEEAHKLFSDTIKKYPKSARAHYEYAAAFEREEKYDDAVNELQSAIDINKNYSEAYFKLADVYVQDNDEKKAESTLKKVAGFKASNGEEYFNRGKAYFKLGENEKAEKNFKLAVQKGYDCTYLFIGRICERNGNYSEAAGMYGKMLEDKTQKNNNQLYLNTAACYAKAEEYDKAAEFAEKAVSNKSDSGKNDLKNLVIYEEKSGNYEKALENARKYLNLYKDRGMEKEVIFIKNHIDNASDNTSEIDSVSRAEEAHQDEADS